MRLTLTFCRDRPMYEGDDKRLLSRDENVTLSLPGQFVSCWSIALVCVYFATFFVVFYLVYNFIILIISARDKTVNVLLLKMG